MRTENFLTIGALAKITGTKVKALRYYEKIGILIPNYINPENGYRYYSKGHIYLVEAIRLCAELNIPLNEFKNYVSEDYSQIQIASLIEQGIIRANQKINELKNTLKSLEDVQKDIKLAERMYAETGEREITIDEKDYWILPFTGKQGTKEYYTMLVHLYDEIEKNSLSCADEYEEGIVLFDNGQEQSTYVYIALNKDKKNESFKQIVRIPCNHYMCKISSSTDIKESQYLFTTLNDINYNKVIFQIELYTKIYNVNSPRFEVRHSLKKEQ